MFKHKKGIAILVMICFIATFLPSAALASTDVQQSAETVVYNLADQEVTVGTDAETADQTPNLYKLFEADGSYTIQLEDNAFFPYEVQFQANGNTETVWFETPDSVVNIGGHDFRVKTNQTDANQIAQLSFKVGDKTVVAYPKEKTFTAKPRPATRTLLPIRCTELNVDFSDASPAEMNMIQVETVLSGVDTTGKTILYASKDAEDSFKPIAKNGFISVSSHDEIQFIVGTGNQLDSNNERYVLSVSWNKWWFEDWLRAEQSVEKPDGTRISNNVRRTHNNYYYNNYGRYLSIVLDVEDILSGDNFYSIKPGKQFIDKGYTVKIFEGMHYNPDDLSKAKDITSQIWNVNMEAKGSGYKNMIEYTLALYSGDTLKGYYPFEISIYSTVNSNYTLRYADLRSEDKTYVRDEYRNGFDQGEVKVVEYSLNSNYPIPGKYYVSYDYHADGKTVPSEHIADYVEKAVEGNYAALSDATMQEDIKGQLYGEGYLTTLDNSLKEFTIFEKNGEIDHFGIQLAEVPKSEPQIPETVEPLKNGDPFLRIQGVAWSDAGIGNYAASYVMRGQDDGYYQNGYQTVMVLDENVDLTKVIPDFELATGVNVYVNGVKQIPGVTSQDFSKGPVMYSVAAENGINLKNYWITVLKKNPTDAELFVNGANKKDENGKVVRELLINESTNNKHDIFISNLGAKELTGLKVELSKDAQNIALDQYWTVGGEGNNSMLPFETISTPNYPDQWGQIPNVAKIRLLAKGQGDIKGTLTVSADGIEPVAIELTGTTRPPKIITEKIPDAVKYVPYETLIQTDNMYDSNNIDFNLEWGELPRGLYLLPDGEIYGTPLEAGTFEIVVGATINGKRWDQGSNTIDFPFTLTVLDNTDSNVSNATDAGYDVSIEVPEYMETYEDKVFESQGALDEFTDFWLDGQKLVRDQDYIAENGSTKITIKAQTFKKRGTGKHTIAAEFHPNHSRKHLKRAAQNYQIKGKRPGGGGGGHVVPPKPEPPKPEVKPDTIKEFKDVPANAWYAEVVKWANKTGYMVGVGNQMFAPNAQVSVATVVTVLSRVGKIDLTQYEGQSFPDVPEGQWYTNPGKWVKATNLLGDMKFTAEPPIARAKIAILLVNFFEQVGVDVPEVKNPVAFNDADQMSAEEQDAFQKLYQMGIFKGVGNNKMNPKGNTTRAELAALLQRVNNTLAK